MVHQYYYFIIVILFLAGLFLHERIVHAKHIAVGQMAPDFSLPDSEGVMHHLADMVGTKVALVFYPKDGSLWCTEQACSLRSGYDELKEKGIIVWGISADTTSSHHAFSQKHSLPFTLLSDPVKTVIAQYGLKGWLFDTRRTFLINEIGTVVAIITAVNTKKHAQQIIDVFGKTNRP